MAKFVLATMGNEFLLGKAERVIYIYVYIYIFMYIYIYIYIYVYICIYINMGSRNTLSVQSSQTLTIRDEHNIHSR